MDARPESKANAPAVTSALKAGAPALAVNGNPGSPAGGGGVSYRLILRGSMLSGLGMLVIMAGQLGAVILFTRQVSEAAVGVYALFILFGDLAILATNMGLWPALPSRIASAPPDEAQRIVGSAIGFQLFVSLAVGAIVVAGWTLLRPVAAAYPSSKFTSLFPFLWALPLYNMAGNIREISASALAGLNRYAQRTAGLALGSVFYFVIVGLGVGILGMGLSGLVACTLVAHGSTALLLYLMLPRSVRRLRFEWLTFRRTIAFSWPLYINSCLNACFQRLDSALVGFLVGFAGAAHYEYGARRLAGYGARTVESGLVPFLPNLSRLIAQDRRDDAARLLQRTAAATGLVCYTGVFVAIVFQEVIVQVLLTEAYLRALPAFPPVLVAACLLLQAGVMGQTLIALGRPRPITAINALAALLSVGLNLVMIPRFGLAGAGWVAVAASAFSLCAQTAVVWRSGLRVSRVRLAQPNVAAALALGVVCCGQTIPWRLVALVLFLALTLGGGLVSAHEVKKALHAVGHAAER